MSNNLQIIRFIETCPNSLDSESMRNSQFKKRKEMYPSIEEFKESKEPKEFTEPNESTISKESKELNEALKFIACTLWIL